MSDNNTENHVKVATRKIIRREQKEDFFPLVLQKFWVVLFGWSVLEQQVKPRPSACCFEAVDFKHGVCVCKNKDKLQSRHFLNALDGLPT